MKNYYGMVAVQAQPMTKGEACSNGILSSINDDEKSVEGYVVIGIDGERSWMPKDKFENIYVNSVDKISELYLKRDSTFIERLIDELRGLHSKLGKLNAFIDSGKIHNVISDPYQKAMLCLQRRVMNAYTNILECRIGRLEAAPEAPLHDMTFGLAVELLKMGHVLRRSGWNGKNLYVCRQIPALIEEDVIPKMQSLPEQMKDIILNGKGFISYESQCLIYNGDTGRADSWVPSISDIFANDWELII